MNRITAAPETKVAAAGITGYTVSLLIQILSTYVPHFHAPPATLVALLVTTLSALAGWLAPHTSRTPMPDTVILNAAPVPPARARVLDFGVIQGQTPADVASHDQPAQPPGA